MRMLDSLSLNFRRQPRKLQRIGRVRLQIVHDEAGRIRIALGIMRIRPVEVSVPPLLLGLRAASI